MCKEVPWNNPKTWEYIDLQHGIAFEALEKMYEIVGRKEKEIANFR